MSHITFQISMIVKIQIVVSWTMTAYSPAVWYQHLEGILLTSAGLKQFKYGQSIFLQNITTQLLHQMLSQFEYHTPEILTVIET